MRDLQEQGAANAAGAEAGGRAGGADAAGSNADKGSEGGQKRYLLIALLILAVVLVIVIVNLVVGGSGSSSQFDELLTTGNRYLEEQEYEQAIVVFDSAIALEPRKAAGYLGKGSAEYMLTWYEDAHETVIEGLDTAEDDTSGLEELLVLIEEVFERVSMEKEAVEAGDAAEAEDAAGAQAEGESASGISETSSAVEIDYGYTVSSQASNTMLLNYESIQVPLHSGDYGFQLEVLNAGENERYIWYLGPSAEEENVWNLSVTEDGLLTFTTDSDVEEDSFTYESYRVYVKNASGKEEEDHVTITIKAGIEKPYYETRIRMDDSEGNPRIYKMSTVNDAEAVLENLASYIYYSGDVEIPAQLTVNGSVYDVTEVYLLAFKWSSDMETLYIPSSVETIGGMSGDEKSSSNPFLYAKSLREITVDEGNPAFTSIDGVLYSKDGTILYSYPAAKEGTSFTIPAGVETVADGAFYNCRNLEEILVAEGNTCFRSEDGVLINISKGALTAWPAGKTTKEYEVPDGVTSVRTYALDSAQIEILYTGSVSALSLDESAALETIVCGDALQNLEIRKLERFIEIESAENLNRLIIYVEEPDDLSWTAEMPGLTALELWFGSCGEIDLDSLEQLSGLTSLKLCYPLSDLTMQMQQAGDGTYETVDDLVMELQEEAQEELPDCTVTVGWYS